MSVTNTQSATPGPGTTSGEVRPKGLKLPPPEPPRFSLTLKIFLAMALLILIAVGGAVAVAAYRARQVADAKIDEDLKKAGPGWESFQQNRYDELHRALAVVVNNAGTISMMSTLVPETGEPDPATVFDTLKREQASGARADFMIATNPRGVALARTDRPAPLLGGSLERADDRGRAPGRADRGDLALGRQALPGRRDAGPRGRLAADGRDRRGLPDQRRGGVEPRAAAQHAGRVPRRRGASPPSRRRRRSPRRRWGPRPGPAMAAIEGRQRSRAGGSAAGEDDRAARAAISRATRTSRTSCPSAPRPTSSSAPPSRCGAGTASSRPSARSRRS